MTIMLSSSLIQTQGPDGNIKRIKNITYCRISNILLKSSSQGLFLLQHSSWNICLCYSILCIFVLHFQSIKISTYSINELWAQSWSRFLGSQPAGGLTAGGRLPLLFARPAVTNTYPAEEHHCLLAGTKLYCLVTEARVLHILSLLNNANTISCTTGMHWLVGWSQ